MPEVITDVKTVGTGVTGAPGVPTPPPPAPPAPSGAWIIAGALIALASAAGAAFLIKKRGK